MTVRGLVADPDGAGIWRHRETGQAGDFLALGRTVGQALKAAAPPAILAA